MPSFELEQAVRERAKNPDIYVAGVDEVGVGSLAGPIVAAAVVLPTKASWLIELDDSKRLAWRKRERLHDLIMAEALAVGIGYETNDIIDNVGIADARRRAILKAFQGCKEALGDVDIAAVVDDRRLGWLRADLGGRPSIFSDKADSKSYCVTPGSKVLTYDLQWVSVETLKLGDNLLSFDEMSNGRSGRFWRKGTVISTGISIEPVYEIRLSNGDILTSTGEHPWIVTKSRMNVWKSTNELRAKDIYSYRPNRLVKFIDTWDVDETYKAGFLAAAFDGEGCLSRYQLQFSQNDNEFFNAVATILKEKGFAIYFTGKNNNNVKVIYVSGQQDIMRFLGQTRPPRLLSKWSERRDLKIKPKYRNVEVSSVTPIGPRPVVNLSVDTRTYLVNGYGAHNSAAAASIVAKVLRDRYMTLAANNHPHYKWSDNKGYGTPEHLEALKKYGPSPLHRKTFSPLRQMLTER